MDSWHSQAVGVRSDWCEAEKRSGNLNAGPLGPAVKVLTLPAIMPSEDSTRRVSQIFMLELVCKMDLLKAFVSELKFAKSTGAVLFKIGFQSSVSRGVRLYLITCSALLLSPVGLSAFSLSSQCSHVTKKGFFQFGLPIFPLLSCGAQTFWSEFSMFWCWVMFANSIGTAKFWRFELDSPNKIPAKFKHASVGNKPCFW